MVVASGVVDEVEDDEAFFAGSPPGSPAQLLEIDHLRKGRAGHEEHFDIWTIPALIEQVAGAEHAYLAASERIETGFPFGLAHPAGHSSGGDALRAESFGQILTVTHVHTECDGLAARNMALLGLD